MACGIFVPWPGIEPTPPVVTVRGPHRCPPGSSWDRCTVTSLGTSGCWHGVRGARRSPSPVHVCPLGLLAAWFGACHPARPACHRISPHHWGQRPVRRACESPSPPLTRTVRSPPGCCPPLAAQYLSKWPFSCLSFPVTSWSLGEAKEIYWDLDLNFFLKFRHPVWSLTRTWPHGRNMVQISVPKGQDVIVQATWGPCVVWRTQSLGSWRWAFFKPFI